MASKNINKHIHAVIPKPCLERPFVCDGRPETCDVIVIGENPATQLATDWWVYWDDKTGFDIQKFQFIYEAERAAKNKAPLSNTRRRLKRLRDKGLLCLETNVFRNEKMDGSGRGVCNTELMKVFFTELPRLKAIITHGKVAQRFLQAYATPVGIKVYAMSHFKGESYENIDLVSNEILSL